MGKEKIVDFKGIERTKIDISNYSNIRILNYDKDWIYFCYGMGGDTNKISRMNRTTYTIEELYTRGGTLNEITGEFFDVYSGLAVFTDYDSATNSNRLAIMNLNNKAIVYSK